MNTAIKRNLQNEILDLLINESKLVEFYFLGEGNTRSTRGVVNSYDEFRINIDSFGRQLSIYKQSISHISSLSGGRNVNRNKPRFGNNPRNNKSNIRTWHSSENSNS